MLDGSVNAIGTVFKPKKKASENQALYYGPLGRHCPFQSDPSSALTVDELQHLDIPNCLGQLGEPPPISSPADYTWVLDQIRGYPLAFAEQGQTAFIHKSLYHGSFPRPLRAAFGICAGSMSISERNRSVLFHALDAEVTELLKAPSTGTLLEDLVRLQAAVLYQIIRLFHGGLEQRIVAEQQEFPLRSFGLTLLQRAEVELRNVRRIWEIWIFAESIRRTVLIAFKVYTMYAIFKHGKCAEGAAMQLLPVSVKPGSWFSRDAYLQDSNQDETMTYYEFSSLWSAAPRKASEPYEKLLLVGCRGMERFAAMLGYQGVVA